MDWLRKYDRVI
jgi:hypothetical protein